MRFAELFSLKNRILSFEFFPPAKPELLLDTKQMIEELKSCAPDFMTVTYGAGGGTRELTKELVGFIHNQLKLPAVAHLTCVGHSVQDIDSVLLGLRAAGISNILALRGDPPKGSTSFERHLEGLGSAEELVRHIKRQGDFSLAVAGYPEIHREAKSEKADLEYLKRKVDAGAEVIITQLFFSAEVYFRFVENARSNGITVPILPGIMPIANVAQIKRFTSMCGASIPDQLAESLNTIKDSPEEVVRFGTNYATELSAELLSGGAPGVHLYTLNKAAQVKQIVQSLKLGAFAS